VTLCSPGWLQTCNPPASVSWVLWAIYFQPRKYDFIDVDFKCIVSESFKFLISCCLYLLFSNTFCTDLICRWFFKFSAIFQKEILMPNVNATNCKEQFGVRDMWELACVTREPWENSRKQRLPLLQKKPEKQLQSCYALLPWLSIAFSVAEGNITVSSSPKARRKGQHGGLNNKRELNYGL
jgi:hypothetical protein